MKNFKWKRYQSALMVFALCLMLFGFAAPRTAAAAGGKVTSAREAVDGVVLVTSESESGTYDGTGFAIGTPGEPVRYIVTNYHVIDNVDIEGGEICVYFSAAANNYMTAELYWRNSAKDIAVLRLPEETTLRTALVLCPMESINLDDTFTALGYPGIANAGNDFIKYDKEDIVITRGAISKSTRVEGRDVYLIDIAISNGSSGGPLVNSKGEVVGINTFGYSDDDDKANYAIAIDELIYSINRKTIPVTLSTDVQAETTTKIIIAVCVVVVAIVIIVVIILVSRSKKKNKKSVIKADSVEFVLLGVGGSMDKREFVIPTRGISIGRDTGRCTVVYPMEEPGISGLHCTTIPTADGLLLKDENSSYGTFYNNQKMAPGASAILKNGERFYLAEVKNTFLVTVRNK